MTVDALKCELCQAVNSLYKARWFGIECNIEYLEDRIHKLYKYIYLKENVTCSTDYVVDCIIEKGE